MMNKQIVDSADVEDLALHQFLDSIKSDPRVTPYHVSLFVAIIYFKREGRYRDKILAFSHQLMPLAKISSSATYHRCIRDLHDFGYISYEASFNRFAGSSIKIS